MDNAYLGSVDISIKKAKTVTLFNGLFPSDGLYDRSKPSGDLYGIEETNDGLVCVAETRLLGFVMLLTWVWFRWYLGEVNRSTIMMDILLGLWV